MKGLFKVFTDINPLTYILTTAKLDATGQRWVTHLASYNFTLHYKSGKQNVDAEALSWIPWVVNTPMQTLDQVTVKAIINRESYSDSFVLISFFSLHQHSNANQHNSKQPLPTHNPPTGTPHTFLHPPFPAIHLGGGIILFPIIIHNGKYMHPPQTPPLFIYI